MSSSTGLFTNDTRAQGVRSLRAARGRGRHNSILDNVQSRAARRSAARREVTPFDFNIGRYQVSPLQISCNGDETDLQSLGISC